MVKEPFVGLAYGLAKDEVIAEMSGSRLQATRG
jgi:hypothetical protein